MGAHDEDTYAGPVRALPPTPAARRPLRWVVAGAVVLLTTAVGIPAVGADEARPTNYESVIDSVRPKPKSLRVEIVGGDAFVQVTVEPGTEVQIPGYDGEPYLRVDADGTVLRNRRSAATYINEERYGDTEPLPDRVDAAAAPDWERIGDGGVVAWHDHRVHWMLDSPPQTGDGVVQPWTVPMSVDGAEVQVEGRVGRGAGRGHDETRPFPAAEGAGIRLADERHHRPRRLATPPGLQGADHVRQHGDGDRAHDRHHHEQFAQRGTAPQHGRRLHGRPVTS